MGISGIAVPPIVFSTLLISTELYLRFAARRRLKCPYFAQGWWFAINVVLWLTCIILAGLSLKLSTHEKEILKKRSEKLSLVSFQIVWMQAAVLNIYHLRLVLFEPTFRPWMGLVGLSVAAFIQVVGTVVCVCNTVPEPRHDLKDISVACLHGGWALYYAIFLLWVSWICSAGGTSSLFPHILGNGRVLWNFVAPLISALVGGTPFSLLWKPQVVFLIVCSLQWLLCTIPVVTSCYKEFLGQRPSFDAMHMRMSLTQTSEGDDRMSGGTPASTIASREDDHGTLRSKDNAENLV